MFGEYLLFDIEKCLGCNGCSLVWLCLCNVVLVVFFVECFVVSCFIVLFFVIFGLCDYYVDLFGLLVGMFWLEVDLLFSVE